MIEHSPNIGKLTSGLHAAQAHFNGVAKDSKNPHFKNNYASLEAVVDTAKGPLQEAGLAFTQAPGVIVDGAIEITTMLMHTSGEWLRSTLHVPLSKKDAQGVGSAITYGCRYALMATLGLPPVDDDGEAAVKPEPKREDGVPRGARSDNLSSRIKATLLSAIKQAKTKRDLEDWGQHPETKKTIADLDQADRDEVRAEYKAQLSALDAVELFAA
jgi:hypothetical protein